MVNKPGMAATCTESGFGESTECFECGKILVAPALLNPIGHDFSAEFTVDKEATYTQTGVKSKHCLREGCTEQSEVTEIPILASTFTDSEMAVLANNVVMMIPGMNIKQLLSLASDGGKRKTVKQLNLHNFL